MSNIRNQGDFEGVSQGTLDWINAMFSPQEDSQDVPSSNLDGEQDDEYTSLARSSRDEPTTSRSKPANSGTQHMNTSTRSYFAAERDYSHSTAHSQRASELGNAGQTSTSQQKPVSSSMDTSYQHTRASPEINFPPSTSPTASAPCSTSLAHFSLYQTDDLPQPFGASADDMLQSTQATQHIDTQNVSDSFAPSQPFGNTMHEPQIVSPEMNLSPMFLTNPQMPSSKSPYMPMYRDTSQSFPSAPPPPPSAAFSYPQPHPMSPPKRRRTLHSEPERAFQPSTYYSDPPTGPPSLLHNSSSLSSSMTPKTPASPSSSSYHNPRPQQHHHQHMTKPRPTPLSVPDDDPTTSIFPSVETPASPERARELQRNRLAAKKSRNKKREYTEDLAVRSRDYGAQNRALKERVKGLRDEVQGLRDEIRRHRDCGGWDEEMGKGVEAYLQRVDEQEGQEVEMEMSAGGDDDQKEMAGADDEDGGGGGGGGGETMSGLMKMEDEET